MKRRHIFKGLMAVMFLMSATQSLMAQEAFYIYRNDGDFNGFFYDQVIRMNMSKIDFDGVEHDDYVIQEVETEDSLYRIPLVAIDSISFVQPEIVFAKKFYMLGTEDCPYKSYRYGGFYVDFEGEDDMTLHWYKESIDREDGTWYYPESSIPKVGDVLFYDMRTSPDVNSSFVFVGKVKEVHDLPEAIDYSGQVCEALVVCDYIDNIGDVFEQFVSVEQIGIDSEGKVRQRSAGTEAVRHLIRGNKDLTLASLTGTFPLTWKTDDEKFSATLGMDVDLKMKAIVAYNVSRSDFNVNITVKEDASLGVSLTAQGVIEDVTTLPLAGLPIPFPSFLPIFEVNPMPGAFIKVSGDVSLKVSSPKFAFHGVQSVSITDGGVSGNCTTSTSSDEADDQNWGIELSLNGSTHAGAIVPFHISTNSWFKKIVSASVGADVYVGPRFDASFTLDPAALIGGDIYNSFKSSSIGFTPLYVNFEADATYSLGGGKEKKERLFNGEGGLGRMSIQLFPDFEKSTIGTPSLSFDVHFPFVDNFYRQSGDTTFYYSRPTPFYKVPYTVRPRALSLPCTIGARVYNEAKEVCGTTYYGTAGDEDKDQSHLYSLFQTFDEISYTMPMLDGKYTIVPLINMFGADIPVWSDAQQITVDLPVDASVKYVNKWYRWKDGSNAGDISCMKEGVIQVKGLMFEDEVEIEFVRGTETIFPDGGIDQRSLSSMVDFLEIGRENDSFASDDYTQPLMNPEYVFGAERTLRRNFSFKVSALSGRGAGGCVYRVKATRKGRTRYSDEFSFDIPTTQHVK